MIDIAAEAKAWLEREIAAGRLPPKPDATSLARVAAIVNATFRNEKAADASRRRRPKPEDMHHHDRPAA